MWKAVLGFVAGALVTILATNFVGGSSHVPSVPERVDENAGPITSTEIVELRESSPFEPVVEVEPAPSLGSSGVRLSNLIRLRHEADEAEQTWQRREYEFNRALAALPAEHPIELPPEFDWVAERISVLHAFIERERVDPDWAPNTEAQLMDFFAKRPDLIEKYGYPAVVCRTTRCEVQLVSYAANESQTETLLRWSGISASILEESWAQQFKSDAEFGHPANSYHEVNEQQGLTTILWHLWKSTRVDAPRFEFAR